PHLQGRAPQARRATDRRRRVACRRHAARRQLPHDGRDQRRPRQRPGAHAWGHTPVPADRDVDSGADEHAAVGPCDRPVRIAATLLGAVCYALALPPFDWPAFGWVALAPFLWAVRGTSAGSACRLGLLYGYAFGWAATWPFAEAIVRYFDLPLPLAVLTIRPWYLVLLGGPVRPLRARR